jgi:ATP-binding cassette subfamily B protein/ATP-binding cassette subfamily C protein
LTLKNINVKLSGTEHLTIVGENGAGKTTFIKLLCGLYKPSDGYITVNGINISDIDEEEYRALFSVVFQDYKLFACTVKENITFDKAGKADDSLRKAGLADRILSLKSKENTPVFKLFDTNGIELSGGEGQKLALARALFKDTPIVVLDEPTAALDPYSEYEIFDKFHENTKEKLVVFISHRLSSCKLSDRILVFKGGEITQNGSHDELISDTDNTYCDMYMAQAKYYMSPY